MEQLNTFDSFDKKNLRRRTLLPIWMKFFTWLFLIAGGFAITLPLVSLFLSNINLSIYGFATNQLWTFDGVTILIIFLFKGLVAFGLWFEKDWAIKLGIVDAVFGIIICLYSMFIQHSTWGNFDFNIRLEILVLVPYLIKLWKLKSIW